MNVGETARAARDGMTVTDVATVVSAIVAIIGAAIAVISATSARRSMQLAKTQEERRLHRLDLYLSDATTRRLDEGRFLSCVIVITNPADSPNTLVSLDLHVSLVREDGVVIKIKVNPSATASPGQLLEPPLSLPARIEPRSAIAGRVGFELPDRVVGGHRVDRYDLVIRDTDQRTETIEIAVFREVLEDLDETDT